MGSSLLTFVNNLSKGIHKIKRKYGHNDKKCKTCGITYEVRNCFLEYTNFKDDLIEYKCLCCKKKYQQKFDEKLKDQFFNSYTFSIYGNNKFILLLWKGVCLYEYVDDWEKFDETSWPEKGDFYNHLNMEDITGAAYVHTKRVCKDFEIKNLGEYNHLCVQSDTLLLVMYLRTFEICRLKFMTMIIQNFFHLLD